MQLCKQQNFAEEIERIIRLFSWKHARNPAIDQLQRFNTMPMEIGERIFIDNWPRWGWTQWPKRFVRSKARCNLRSKDVVIHTLPEGLEVSAEMGRHPAAQLIKAAMQAEATRFLEGDPRTWTRKLWDPDIFNHLVGVLQRKEKENRLELWQMLR